MRQPWPQPLAPSRSWLRVVAALAATQNRPKTPPPGTPTRRIPWRMIAAVTGASLLGVWLFRPTQPPRPWVTANRARSRRLEELEDRYVQADLLDRARSYDQTHPEDRWGSPSPPTPPSRRTLASPSPTPTHPDDEVYGDLADSTRNDPEDG